VVSTIVQTQSAKGKRLLKGRNDIAAARAHRRPNATERFRIAAHFKEGLTTLYFQNEPAESSCKQPASKLAPAAIRVAPMNNPRIPDPTALAQISVYRDHRTHLHYQPLGNRYSAEYSKRVRRSDETSCGASERANSGPMTLQRKAKGRSNRPIRPSGSLSPDARRRG